MFAETVDNRLDFPIVSQLVNRLLAVKIAAPSGTAKKKKRPMLEIFVCGVIVDPSNSLIFAVVVSISSTVIDSPRLSGWLYTEVVFLRSQPHSYCLPFSHWWSSFQNSWLLVFSSLSVQGHYDDISL